MQLSSEQRRAAFSFWLRTGRWPRRVESGALELKFNPWHDPRNGRFTFGPGGPRSASGRRQDGPPAPFVEDRKSPSVTTAEQADAITDKLMAKYGNQPELREKIKDLNQYYKDRITERSNSVPSPTPAQAPATTLAKVAEFVGGAGEGLYASGQVAITSAYKIATTNPVTTVRNLGKGIAGTIDTILAAEDTPAYVHLRQAANAAAHASAHDWGYAVGRVGGDVAITAVPGAVVARISAASRVSETVALAASTERRAARFGISTSSNYRATFFKAHPELQGRVVVHHAVEQQIIKKYPGVVSKYEIHSLENLRGIPKSLSGELHSGYIRKEWNRFYKKFDSEGRLPTKEELIQKASDIDAEYGSKFNPPW